MGGRGTASGAPGFREMAPGEREEESNTERGVKEGVRSSGRKALVPECVWYRKSSSLALIIHAFLCTMDLPRQRYALVGKKKKAFEIAFLKLAAYNKYQGPASPDLLNSLDTSSLL